MHIPIPTTEEIRNNYLPHIGTALSQWHAQQFDRWLKKIKAEAWEQGFKANFESASTRTIVENPYRTEHE